MPWLRVFAAYATPLVDIISVIGRWLDSKGHYHGSATTPPTHFPINQLSESQASEARTG